MPGRRSTVHDTAFCGRHEVKRILVIKQLQSAREATDLEREKHESSILLRRKENA
jgi:hypothetical protein